MSCFNRLKYISTYCYFSLLLKRMQAINVIFIAAHTYYNVVIFYKQQIFYLPKSNPWCPRHGRWATVMHTQPFCVPPDFKWNRQLISLEISWSANRGTGNHTKPTIQQLLSLEWAQEINCVNFIKVTENYRGTISDFLLIECTIIYSMIKNA